MKPDLVLVDGRFRVACALQAIVNTMPGVEIMIHDFFARQHYYDVLHFADIVDCADNLVVLRAKQPISDSIGKSIEKFVTIPA